MPASWSRECFTQSLLKAIDLKELATGTLASPYTVEPAAEASVRADRRGVAEPDKDEH